jgi:predicted RNase H-like HicB family nuclease
MSWERMVETMNRPTYKITVEMDTNGWWFVDVPDVPGAHTQGQTLARARANAREVIALMGDLPSGAEDSFDLDETIKLPGPARQAVTKAQRAREKAERAAAEARKSTEEALDVLAEALPGLGLRDQAELVGVSYQRVAQLRPGAPRRGRRPAPAH